ncbi:MAG: helix-turn-helix domain-containing protein [Prevotella sp.]|jgi:excisionase family DNA binding protein|nr:helix-turn-helix domain-containing protein [Prevotella sp.]
MARLITRQEAARLLDVSTQTVSNWIEKGYIKAHMLDNYLMVDRETIEQHFDSL